MKTHDIFSKRQKRNRGDVSDVYQYEHIPPELRIQVVYIIGDLWEEVSNQYHRYFLRYANLFSSPKDLYKMIHEILCREYGRFSLVDYSDSDREAVVKFFTNTMKVEEAIDVIEVSMSVMERLIREAIDVIEVSMDRMARLVCSYSLDAQQSMDSAIEVLNHRFREHGVGYQYESGKIIRVDSELVHAEVVKPALSLLADPMYAGANDEFLKAHAHYRARENKECMNECLKAFESCLKAICDKRRWAYKDTAAAKDLVDIVLRKGLVPRFMESPFNGFKSALIGVATLRNKRSGHGQGGKIVEVPESMASYTLHLTASNILLLARADKEMK